MTPALNNPVIEALYNLTDNRDLSEIENICTRKDKFTIVVDETVMVPFRHIRYEKITKEEKL
jgi:hypothetical protein